MRADERPAGAIPGELGDFRDGALDSKGPRGGSALAAELEASRTAFELSDPLGRAHFFSAPGSAASVPPPGALLSVNLAELVTRLVRRVAWGGDGRRGTVRIEIGGGELSGATLVVSAVARTVSVELELPPGVCPESWQKRITERLTARGLDLDEVVVR